MARSRIKKQELYEEPALEVTVVDEIENSNPSISPIPVLPQLSVALGLLVFIFAVTYVGSTGATQKATALDVRVEKVATETPIKTLPKKNDAFNGVTLRAESALVWDVSEQKILFNKDAEARRPLASITKLMTALVTYELLDPDDRVTITDQALHEEGDSGLREGERFSVRDLANLTLITSSNDGAAALSARAGSVIDKDADAEAIFVTAMNVKAEELGLTKTHFKNSTGLDINETEAGAYGSARDVARLMEYVITTITDKVALTNLDLTSVRNLSGEYHTAKNTNPNTTELEGLIASKTGYTSLSGGNLVVALNVGLNHPIVIVVLGSSYDGRFSDTVELAKRARAYVGSEE